MSPLGSAQPWELESVAWLYYTFKVQPWALWKTHPLIFFRLLSGLVLGLRILSPPEPDPSGNPADHSPLPHMHNAPLFSHTEGATPFLVSMGLSAALLQHLPSSFTCKHPGIPFVEVPPCCISPGVVMICILLCLSHWISSFLRAV